MAEKKDVNQKIVCKKEAGKKRDKKYVKKERDEISVKIQFEIKNISDY